jgi:hypothetical protein
MITPKTAFGEKPFEYLRETLGVGESSLIFVQHFFALK